jgi:hypothetical protein
VATTPGAPTLTGLPKALEKRFGEDLNGDGRID